MGPMSSGPGTRTRSRAQTRGPADLDLSLGGWRDGGNPAKPLNGYVAVGLEEKLAILPKPSAQEVIKVVG